MGNRKQPFGYRIELGVVVLHPEEAPLVTYIYEQYTLGASFNALVNDLRKQAVRYDGDKQWNKNMVARILEDERYLGEKGFPPLIQPAMFQRAQELRSAKQNMPQRTEAEKLLRQLSGRPATAAIQRDVTNLLNDVIRGAVALRGPHRGDDPAAIHAIENKVQSAMEQMPMDEENAKVLLSQLAAARYEAIDPNIYETARLQRLFSRYECQDELQPELLRSAVSAIQIQQNGSISLRLKNGQIVARRESQ